MMATSSSSSEHLPPRNVIISYHSDHLSPICLTFPRPPTLASVLSSLPPNPCLTLYHTTVPLQDAETLLPDQNVLYLKARVKGAGLCGGKGGFGAVLRGSRSDGATDDFGSCRNLEGRRLRDVENGKRVREWMERGGAEEEVEDDGKSESGKKKRRKKKRRKEMNSDVDGGEEKMENLMEQKVERLEKALDTNARRTRTALMAGLKRRRVAMSPQREAGKRSDDTTKRTSSDNENASCSVEIGSRDADVESKIVENQTIATEGIKKDRAVVTQDKGDVNDPEKVP